MKIKVRHFKGESEVMAIEAFLDFQCKRHLAEIEYENDPRVLGLTKGHPGVFILIEHKYKPHKGLEGFKKLLEYWEEEGLWMC